MRRILDIEIPVKVIFGSTRKTLAEVLRLGPGALLELDRGADEPVALKVNDQVFARGHVVEVEGHYGIQITEILERRERIVSLGGAS